MKAAKDFFPELTSSVIWNEAPASDWAESYPLGNGRIGAMVQGRAKEEIISLNHDLLWRDFMSQPEYNTFEDMPRIKELCAQKKWYEANELLKQTLPNQNAIYINPFVPACDLYLNMMHGDQEITGYRRALDMEKGVVTVEYDCGGTHYTRAAFCSWEKGLFVLHLTGSHPSALTGMFSLSRLPEEECEVTGTGDKDTLTLHGRFAEGKEFAAAARIYCRNGRIAGGKKVYGIEGEEIFPRHFGLGYVFNRDQYISAERGCSLWFDSCAEVTIVVSIATDADEKNVDEAVIEKVASFGCNGNYPAVRDEHIARFSSFAGRMQLNLGDEASAALPGNQVIKFDPEKDEISPALTEKMFRLARYVLESSGMTEKPGEHQKAPINLQGLWNRDTRPAWESDYHTDLNIEMCYWPTGAGAMIEFFEPMLTWAERLLPQARKLAQDVYGVGGASYGGCCDWKTLGGTDIVGGTWTGASAWIAQILWIYYEYDPRTELLERLYSLMLEIEKFYQDILIEDEEGFLLPPFGTSPEMAHIVNGEMQWLSSASTCDLLLIRELYETLAKAATLRGDTETAEKFLATSKRIRKPVIDENGCLREWLENHQEQDPGHRHRSPLVSLCPGSLVARNSDQSDPLVDAMEKLLEKRIAAGGSMATSFSYAWDAQFFARLRRGDEAYHLLTRLIWSYSLDNLMLTTNDWSRTKGGIPWFYGSKVLQVDAQLCLISSISELFYQDTQGVICALPALPGALPTGSMTGIRGRNGFRSDLYWKDGRLEKLTVISTLGQTCRLYLRKEERSVRILCDGQDIAFAIDNGVFSFPTEAGKVYTVVPA